MSPPSVESRLAQLCARFALPPDAERQLAELLDQLARPEAPTSVHEPAQAVDVHIADSLVGLEIPDLRSAEQIADLGAGAGLPGLVLAAALPTTQLALVESVGRKAAFLSGASVAMALANVAVVRARAEEWTDGLGSCDVVAARALASLAVLCEYAAPLLKEGGCLVAWKGAVSAVERADGAAAARLVGLEPESERRVAPFPRAARRSLHVFRKSSPTPPGFPRRPGIATKRPLSAGSPR